jgi:hypothetical protein
MQPAAVGYLALTAGRHRGLHHLLVACSWSNTALCPVLTELLAQISHSKMPLHGFSTA